MNDFESQLQKQTLRPVPGHWKKQILDAAQREATSQQLAEKQSWSWRDLFWPCPQVWVGFAAAWLVVLLLNVSARDDTSSPASMAAKTAPERLDGYEDRQRLLAELLDDNRRTPTPPAFVPRRRSELLANTVAV